MHIDDELVSDVRSEDVFGGVDRDVRCAIMRLFVILSEDKWNHSNITDMTINFCRLSSLIARHYG